MVLGRKKGFFSFFEIGRSANKVQQILTREKREKNVYNKKIAVEAFFSAIK